MNFHHPLPPISEDGIRRDVVILHKVVPNTDGHDRETIYVLVRKQVYESASIKAVNLKAYFHTTTTHVFDDHSSSARDLSASLIGDHNFVRFATVHVLVNF